MNIIIKIAFVLAISSPMQEREAFNLIESIRTFGGNYSQAPVYVFLMDSSENLGNTLNQNNVFKISSENEYHVPKYPFYEKVVACAQAEKLLKEKYDQIIWLDANGLILKPPVDLELKENEVIACRPVHYVNNIGLSPDQPIDGFWEKIYKETNLNYDEVPIIETFADIKEIRAYYNCQFVSIKPEYGIFQKWAKLFAELASDKDYLNANCWDDNHMIFLHQAAFSAILLSELKQDQIKIISPKYTYPLFAHNRLPDDKKAGSMNELVYPIYDIIWDYYPDPLSMIEMKEPIKSFVEEAYFNIKVQKINERVFRQEDKINCNAYLVKTNNGNVVIDPGGAQYPTSALYEFSEKQDLKAIMLTHAHGDHRSGIKLWNGERNIPIIAQKEHVDFINYLQNFKKFHVLRNSVIMNTSPDTSNIGEIGIEPNIFFDNNYKTNIGDLTFELIHTPGETPDHATIWIPEIKTVFCGDNFSYSFPNISTLRGAPPRWALEYVSAMDTILKLEPEYLCMGHGESIIGNDKIKTKLTEYKNAILYVHDLTVKGINEHKDVYTLMNEIKLPESYNVKESFGCVKWSVRGIYEQYIGWFDEQISNMYETPTESIYADILTLSGGADKITDLANKYVAEGDPVKALHLTDIVLKEYPNHVKTLQTRLKAVKMLRVSSRNYMESTWLVSEMNKINNRLKNQNMLGLIL